MESTRKLLGTHVPEDSVIKKLENLSQPVLEALEQISSANIDSTILQASAKILFTQLHQSFGYDLYKKSLGELPSEDRNWFSKMLLPNYELSAEDKKWICEHLIEYNYQLRIFYGNLLEELYRQNYPEEKAQALSAVLTRHSASLKALFDSIAVQVPQPPGQVIPVQQIPQSPIIVVVQEPQPVYQNCTVFYDSGSPYYGHSQWNHSTMGNFWYWQGFNAGYGQRNHPNTFMLFCNTNYNNGYWEGRGAHALVNLMSQTLPRMARGIFEVDREAFKLGVDAFKGIESLFENLPSALVHGIQTFDNLGGQAISAIGSAGSHAIDAIGSASREVVNCCANSNCIGDCGSCAKEGCSDVISFAGNCCSACGSIGKCCGSCEKDTDDAVKKLCAGVAGAVTVIVNAVEGTKNNSSSNPPPIFSSSSTGVANNFTSSLSSSSSTAGRRLLDVSDSQVQITGGALGAVKWAALSLIAATVGVHEGLASGRYIRDIYNNYERRENLFKLSAQWGSATATFLVLNWMPVIGGPHTGMVFGLGAGWAFRAQMEKYYREENRETYQEEQPQRYLLSQIGLLSLRNKMAEEKREYSSLQVQRVLAFLEEKIKEQKLLARRQGGCLNLMFRVWGAYPQTTVQKSLIKALEGLQKGNYPDFENHSKTAGIADPWALFNIAKQGNIPVSAVNLEVEDEEGNDDDHKVTMHLGAPGS